MQYLNIKNNCSCLILINNYSSKLFVQVQTFQQLPCFVTTFSSTVSNSYCTGTSVTHRLLAQEQLVPITNLLCDSHMHVRMHIHIVTNGNAHISMVTDCSFCGLQLSKLLLEKSLQLDSISKRIVEHRLEGYNLFREQNINYVHHLQHVYLGNLHA